jgi:hypothetical protein
MSTITHDTAPAPARTPTDRSVAYLSGLIGRYEQDRASTDTTTETGLAHAAVLDMTIADWRRRLEATIAAA